MTTTLPSVESTAKTKRLGFLSISSQFGAFIFLIVLCVVFAVLNPAFLKPVNIFNVLRQVSIYGLLAIGMTFVILTAGIDLSVGSLLALAGLAAWIGCALGLFLRGVGDDDRMRPRAALAWAVGVAAGLAMFFLGLARA